MSSQTTRKTKLELGGRGIRGERQRLILLKDCRHAKLCTDNTRVLTLSIAPLD